MDIWRKQQKRVVWSEGDARARRPEKTTSPGAGKAQPTAGSRGEDGTTLTRVVVAFVLPRMRDRASVVAKMRALFAEVTREHPYAGRTRGLVHPMGAHLGVDGLLALAVWTRDIGHVVRQLGRLRAEHQLRAVFVRVEGREAFDAAARAIRDLGRAS